MTIRARPVASLAVLLLLGFPASLPGQSSGIGPDRTAQETTTLRPGDVLRISVWPSTDLGGQFTIDETGNVSLPYLGRIQITGMTIEEIRTRLTDGYSEALKNPVITVVPAFRVGVLGEVRSPGVYTVMPSTTLMEVVGMAGGFSTAADPERVRIVRESGVVEVDALRALEEGMGALQVVDLRSGDQVVIPPRERGITFGGVITFVQTAATMAFLIDRALN